MNWVDQFVEYTSSTTSPELFRKWAAISTIAAALERRVWVRTYNSPLYPNMYVVLCAHPGVGKTEVTWRARQLLASLDEFHLAPTSTTKASLVDELEAATRNIVRPKENPPVVNFNALTLCINELGNFLPDYDNSIMNILTDLYDCKQYGESRRSSKLQIQIDNPQINLLAACTPDYLNRFLPEGAWNQGFTSRMIIVYSGDRQVKSLFAESDDHQDQFDSLKSQLHEIYNMYGKMSFTPEAAEMIDRWHMSDGEPKPEHPKLFHYNTRRTAHLLKLSMVAAIVNNGDMTIRVPDIQLALDWLIEVECYMPEIFKAMSGGGPGEHLQDAWYYMFTAYSKEKKPVLQHRLIQFLQERVPVHQIAATLEMMEKGQMITKQLTTAGPAYIPRGKKPGT